MAKGFKQPKGKNPMGMMKQLQQLQEQLLAAQEQLAEETVTATSGGGAVKITVTGDQRCTAVEIDPGLLEDADVEMLQDLILAAVNEALTKSQEMVAAEMSKLTGGLNIPGIM